MSEGGHEGGFCPQCGGAVSFRFIGSDTIDLAVTLFDTPAAFPPHDGSVQTGPG